MITFQNLLFGTVYVPCVLSDIRDYKVPNRWILTGWLTGLVHQIFTYSVQGLFLWIISVLLPILILFPLYAFRVLGAGDIKLISVAFGIYGAFAGFRQLVFIGIAGAAGAFLEMLLKKQLISRFVFFGNYVRRFYMGILAGEGGFGERILGSMKSMDRYYDSKRDGYAPALHFTVYIGIGILLWEVVCL